MVRAGHKIHPNEIAHLASVLFPKDFEGLQDRMPDLIEQSGGMEIVRGFYAIQRLRVMGFDKAQSEGGIKIINHVFQVRSEKEKLAMLLLMDHMLQFQFTNQYDRPSDRHKVFNIPEVKKFIEERYDFNTFIDGKIDLDI